MTSDELYYQASTASPLQARQLLTEALELAPYNPELWYQRGVAHERLTYPELAIGDAYRALLLIDEIREAEFGSEYGEEACSTWRSLRHAEDGELTAEEKGMLEELDLKSRQMLCGDLLLIGCLLDASEQATLALKSHPTDPQLLEIATQTSSAISTLKSASERKLRQGYVARVIYPWNDHEPDRTSDESVAELNEMMEAASGGNFEVRAIYLPTLILDIEPTIETIHTTTWDTPMHEQQVKQLGVYATRDLKEGEEVFHERSILTVNNRLFDTLCDCCNGLLPELTDCHMCPDCDEVTFCSEVCRDEAIEKYHPALCGHEVDWLFKTTHRDLSLHGAAVAEAKKTATTSSETGALYTLLLLKALAMSLTQSIHPLDLLPIKYLYGSSPPPPLPTKPPVLPFTFQDNILSVFHLLTRLDLDPYTTSLHTFDIWHTITIHSKILGTASARHDVVSGSPEVAALHLCYSLVNHNCEPELTWECKSEMVFKMLKDVKQGMQVRDSYTDIRLGWKERREWLMGSLGGGCRCERCVREEAADQPAS